MKQGKNTKAVKIGGFSHVRTVYIGGENRIAVQTMWKDSLNDANIESAVQKIESLQSIGCELLRFAVPTIKSAEVLGRLAEITSMPLVADIHFDYKIALRCMDFPVSKIRINPGNIGVKEHVKKVLEKAGKSGIPIRIGVNAGSLPADLRAKKGEDCAPAMVQAALREIDVFKEFGFTDYLVSMKASKIADNIHANRILSELTDAPLHIGVTEAGPLAAGVARNTVAIVTLINEGIGDTIRVSLSDTMENEIIAGREILAAAAEISGYPRLKCGGVNIISCPRCGRHSFDTLGFTNRWMSRFYAMDKDITIAVMGCEVNGPEEARHADIGITGAGDKVLIFKHGKVVKTITAAEADAAIKEEIDKL
ncbi:MAG: flavodoxin-dependent (E)-4-hydroxy-3-methylbut-2-enyl-diphosphate synthase [Treponema sp.]|nr:flavodoxin-dependent (E)-4-hydroxy-3-methylbut-2-enyl-diphosphate synthase [Treponema sp.]